MHAVLTCTEVGWQESSQAHDLKFGSPDVRRDLSKIVVLWGGKKEEKPQSLSIFSINHLRSKNANTFCLKSHWWALTEIFILCIMPPFSIPDADYSMPGPVFKWWLTGCDSQVWE